MSDSIHDDQHHQENQQSIVIPSNSLLQTEDWAELKSHRGWRPHSLTVADQDPIHVLERSLPFSLSLLYAPEVHLLDCSQIALRQLATALKKLSNSAIFARLELLHSLDDPKTEPKKLIESLKSAGFLKAFESVQPEDRQWVDVTPEPEEILSKMKEKGRYNVRLAEKKGVTTRISTHISDVEVFSRLMNETAKRDGFTPRSHDYFLALCRMLFDRGFGELIIAEFEGTPLCMLLITYYDGLASYLYGASSSQQRNLMAPYAAQFAAMKRAKAKGCHDYDLLQIAPAHQSENHKFAHLTRFKQQFGGRAVHLVGSWDLVFKPVLYQGFKLAEKLRRKS